MDHDLDGAPVRELLRRACADLGDLARVEVELARDEALGELRGALRAAALSALACGAAVMALTLASVALALTFARPALAALVGAGVAAVAAAALALFAWRSLPTSPLPLTRQRLAWGAQHLKETIT